MTGIPSLFRVVGGLTVVVGVLLLVGAYAILGRGRLERTVEEWRPRLAERLPSLLVLGVVVAVTGVAQRASVEFSWLVGWDVTGYVYAVEGHAVAAVQAVATPALTTYLAFAYLYGFSFLLIFPFLAYATLPDVRPFRETVAAFSLNYLVGLAAYTAFIVYGPRNYIPEQVASLLYTHWPAAHLLTSAVSANTDVFPSLHTSFSVTVALLAWRTREALPRWATIAAVGAASVAVATMYLGIHWVTDVVAGVLVGVGCTALAVRDPLADVDRRLGVLLADLGTRLPRVSVSDPDVGNGERDQP